MSAIEQIRPAEDLVNRIQRTAGLMNQDIDAMSESMIATSPGGKARTGLDLIYEVAAFNRLVAKRSRGEAVAGSPADAGWHRAPANASKSSASEEFKSSIADVCDALSGVSQEQLDSMIETPFGAMPLTVLANIVPSHIMYHSGQLNYIQTIHGDDVLHWS